MPNLRVSAIFLTTRSERALAKLVHAATYSEPEAKYFETASERKDSVEFLKGLLEIADQLELPSRRLVQLRALIEAAERLPIRESVDADSFDAVFGAPLRA